MRRRIRVLRDLGGCAPVLHRIAEKDLGSGHIAIAAQEEIDGPAGPIHGPIQVGPTAPNLYIGLVHSPGSAHRRSIAAPALLEFRQIMLDPAQNRGVRQRDASVRHHDDQISQAQFEARVPADTQDDDLSVEMPSLEQCFDWNKLLHSVIIARSRPVCTRTVQDREVRETESDDVGTVERGACRLTPFADPQSWQSPAHLITKASLHQSRRL